MKMGIQGLMGELRSKAVDVVIYLLATFRSRASSRFSEFSMHARTFNCHSIASFPFGISSESNFIELSF